MLCSEEYDVHIGDFVRTLFFIFLFLSDFFTSSCAFILFCGYFHELLFVIILVSGELSPQVRSINSFCKGDKLVKVYK